MVYWRVKRTIMFKSFYHSTGTTGAICDMILINYLQRCKWSVDASCGLNGIKVSKNINWLVHSHKGYEPANQRVCSIPCTFHRGHLSRLANLHVCSIPCTFHRGHSNRFTNPRVCNTSYTLSREFILIFHHLRLCLAIAIHNHKWLKITHFWFHSQ